MTACRFAPSTTGPAHPGTLLAGLLCWLDARSRGARLLLRLEDLDPQRCRPAFADALVDQLTWFGLEFDDIEQQHKHGDRHREALERLIGQGRIYACDCSRARILRTAAVAADGGRVYPGTCRERGLPLNAGLPLRWHLPVGTVVPRCDGGDDPRQDPALVMGDPVLWRRDGVAAYHLASVADDVAVGVDRVVRGRDLVHATAIQHLLFGLLGAAPPIYRHHLLLLERRGDKLSKFHQAVGVPELAHRYTAPTLCGILARACGLRPDSEPVTPADLLADFTWDRVGEDDVVLDWNGTTLGQGDVPGPDRSPVVSSRIPDPATYTWLTPPGPAAIALVETPALPALLNRSLPAPGHARFALLVDPAGEAVDEVVATRLDAGRLELATHAGPGIRQAIEAALTAHGLQAASAPVDDRWGRLAACRHPAALPLLLAEGQVPPAVARWATRVPVVLIAGPPNAGKSTLLNTWCGFPRALVAAEPGTTRDLISVEVIHRGWLLRLVDGAGLREDGDTVERAGQLLVATAAATADVVLQLAPTGDDRPPLRPDAVPVRAKVDLVTAPPSGLGWAAPAFVGTTRSRELLDAIGDAVLARLGLPGGDLFGR